MVNTCDDLDGLRNSCGACVIVVRIGRWNRTCEDLGGFEKIHVRIQMRFVILVGLRQYHVRSLLPCDERGENHARKGTILSKYETFFISSLSSVISTEFMHTIPSI